MEEIEYLEEYEDLVLPSIQKQKTVAVNPNMSNKKGTNRAVNESSDDSIDPDIFESLFDYKSDDEISHKKLDSQQSQRRVERNSLDSIDLLVRDLKSPSLNSTSPTTTLRRKINTKKITSVGNDKPSEKAPNTPTAAFSTIKPRPPINTNTATTSSSSTSSSSTLIKSKTDMKKRSLPNISSKSKSVAAVRPTIQHKKPLPIKDGQRSQQQQNQQKTQAKNRTIETTTPSTGRKSTTASEDTTLTKTVNKAKTTKCETSPPTFSGALKPNTDSGVRMSSTPLPKDSKVTATTTQAQTQSASNTKLQKHQSEKKGTRPNPTIFHAKKSVSVDPIEDPLSFENIDDDDEEDDIIDDDEFASEFDSDISYNSFDTFSDLDDEDVDDDDEDVIDLSTDSSHFDAAKRTLLELQQAEKQQQQHQAAKVEKNSTKLGEHSKIQQCGTQQQQQHTDPTGVKKSVIEIELKSSQRTLSNEKSKTAEITTTDKNSKTTTPTTPTITKSKSNPSMPSPKTSRHSTTAKRTEQIPSKESGGGTTEKLKTTEQSIIDTNSKSNSNAQAKAARFSTSAKSTEQLPTSSYSGSNDANKKNAHAASPAKIKTIDDKDASKIDQIETKLAQEQSTPPTKAATHTQLQLSQSVQASSMSVKPVAIIMRKSLRTQLQAGTDEDEVFQPTTKQLSTPEMSPQKRLEPPVSRSPTKNMSKSKESFVKSTAASNTTTTCTTTTTTMSKPTTTISVVTKTSNNDNHKVNISKPAATSTPNNDLKTATATTNKRNITQATDQVSRKTSLTKSYAEWLQSKRIDANASTAAAASNTTTTATNTNTTNRSTSDVTSPLKRGGIVTKPNAPNVEPTSTTTKVNVDPVKKIVESVTDKTSIKDKSAITKTTEINLKTNTMATATTLNIKASTTQATSKTANTTAKNVTAFKPTTTTTTTATISTNIKSTTIDSPTKTATNKTNVPTTTSEKSRITAKLTNAEPTIAAKPTNTASTVEASSKRYSSSKLATTTKRKNPDDRDGTQMSTSKPKRHKTEAEILLEITPKDWIIKSKEETLKSKKKGVSDVSSPILTQQRTNMATTTATTTPNVEFKKPQDKRKSIGNLSSSFTSKGKKVMASKKPEHHYKCRKLRVRINRSVVKKYLDGLKAKTAKKVEVISTSGKLEDKQKQTEVSTASTVATTKSATSRKVVRKKKHDDKQQKQIEQQKASTSRAASKTTTTDLQRIKETRESKAQKLNEDSEAYIHLPANKAQLNRSKSTASGKAVQMNKPEKTTVVAANATASVPAAKTTLLVNQSDTVEENFTPIEPKIEIDIDADDITPNTAPSSVVPITLTSTRSNGAVEATASSSSSNINNNDNALSFGGSRYYSFVHPEKLKRSQGNVLLEYCCPNLGVPITALQPSQIQSKTKINVCELPAYIVMRTVVMTTKEYEAKRLNLPESVRVKLQQTSSSSVGSSKHGSMFAGTSGVATVGGTTSTLSAMQTNNDQKVASKNNDKGSPLLMSLQKKLPVATTAKTTTTSSTTITTPIMQRSATTIVSKPTNSAIGDQERSVLRSELQNFDTSLSKLAKRFTTLSSSDREHTIEALVNDKIFTSQDINIATQVMHAYYDRHATKTLSTTAAVAASTRATPNNNNNSNNINRGTRSEGIKPNPGKRRRRPIYDSHKNIIGYELQDINETNTIAKTTPRTSTRTDNNTSITTTAPTTPTNSNTATTNALSTTTKTLKATRVQPTTSTTFENTINCNKPPQSSTTPLTIALKKLTAPGPPRIFYTKSQSLPTLPATSAAAAAAIAAAAGTTSTSTSTKVQQSAMPISISTTTGAIAVGGRPSRTVTTRHKLATNTQHSTSLQKLPTTAAIATRSHAICKSRPTVFKIPKRTDIQESATTTPTTTTSTSTLTAVKRKDTATPLSVSISKNPVVAGTTTAPSSSVIVVTQDVDGVTINAGVQHMSEESILPDGDGSGLIDGMNAEVKSEQIDDDDDLLLPN